MTLKQAKDILRPLGMSINWGMYRKRELFAYRVNHIGGKEETAYYTASIADAVATGKWMVKANNALKQTDDAVMQAEIYRADAEREAEIAEALKEKH